MWFSTRTSISICWGGFHNSSVSEPLAMADAGSFKDLLVYDCSTRKWEDIGDGLNIAKPRMGHGVTLSGGKFYVHGGAIPGLVSL